MRKSFVLIAIALITGHGSRIPAASAASDEKKTPAAEGDLGVTACVKCHKEAVASWRANIHRKSDAVPHAPPSKKGCQACRGPDEAHLEAVLEEAKDIKIKQMAKMSPQEVNALCLTCHRKEHPRSHWENSLHAARGLSCLDCHQIHQPRDKTQSYLLKPPAKTLTSGAWSYALSQVSQPSLTRATDLCLSCHREQGAMFRSNSHHPLPEGRMTCADCHDPHGAGEDMHLSERAEELCVRCHPEKRGPFIYAHDMTGAGEGCLTCHQPHGSPNAKLVKLHGRGLCLQCHSDIATEPRHQLRPIACWSAGCHADIHGSQTNRHFLRNGGSGPLLNRTRRDAALPDGTPSVGRARLWSRAFDFSDLRAWVEELGADAPSAKETEKTPSAAPRLTEFESVVSFQNSDPTGNASKYYRYNVKPDGLFSGALRLRLFNTDGFRYGSVSWTGLGEARQTGALRLDGVRSALAYDYDTAEFYVDPSFEPRSPSERTTQTLRLNLTPSRRIPDVGFVVQRQRVEAPGISRLAVGGVPGALNYRNKSYGPELRLPLGSGNLLLQYRRETFSDFTAFLPHAKSDVWQLRYDTDLGERTMGTLAYARGSIRQDGLPGDATNKRLRVGVTSALTRYLTASLQFDSTDISLPNTLNAFVTNNDLFSLRLRYRPQSKWLLEGGYERVGIDRMNNLQTSVDSPRWSGAWLSLRATPAENVTMFARHRFCSLSRAPAAIIVPPTGVVGTPSTASLFFDRDDRTDLRVSVTLPGDALFFVNYGRNDRDNKARQVGIQLDNLDIGFVKPLSKRLLLNFNWNRQDWTGTSIAPIWDPLGQIGAAARP